MLRIQKFVPVLLLALLSGCVFPGVYKINVQQGNIVTEEELARVEQGMTRSQVHSALGTPLTLNAADTSVEYYVYTFQEAGGEIREQKIAIRYDNDSVSEIDTDLLDELPAY